MSNENNKNDTDEPKTVQFGPAFGPAFGMGGIKNTNNQSNQATGFATGMSPAPTLNGGFSFMGPPPQVPQPIPQQAPRSMCGGMGGLAGPFTSFGTNVNEKKKLIDALYSELGNIRAEIEKLHKSTDVIYEILRNI